jgi:PAS domain S-box-containing protein
MSQEDFDPRLVLDTAPALIFSGRPDGYIDYVNRGWLDEIGASLEAVEGRGWMNFIHPDDLEEHLRIWQAALASGDPAISEARVRRANGEYRWMFFRTLPLRDEQGRIVRWFGSSVDVEELRRAREAIQNAERDLRTILETIPGFVWTARPDGAIEFITGGWFERMGHAPEEVLGGGWSNSVHPEDRAGVVRKWKEAVAAGHSLESGVPHSRLPGKLSLVPGPGGSAARRGGRDHPVVRDADGHRRPQARGGRAAQPEGTALQGEHRAARRSQPGLDVRGDRRLIGSAAPRSGARGKGGGHRSLRCFCIIPGSLVHGTLGALKRGVVPCRW